MGNNLIKLVPTLQSITLLENNIQYLKKKKKKSIVKQSVENLIGISLIEETAKFTDF